VKISAGNLVKGINDFIFEWQKTGLVSDSRIHNAYRRSSGVTEITWGDDGYVLTDDRFASLNEYINLVEARQYSILLSEGDILQFSFSLKRDQVVKHRLCWYPCPIRLSRDDIENSSLIDAILEKMNNGDFDDFFCKTPLRFDFDPDNSSEEHPEVHLHMISEDCRLPVKTPLCLRKFIEFISDNFYSEVAEILKLNEKAITWDGGDKLTEKQKAKMHINSFPSLIEKE
jgi:hypothetical protein